MQAQHGVQGFEAGVISAEVILSEVFQYLLEHVFENVSPIFLPTQASLPTLIARATVILAHIF